MFYRVHYLLAMQIAGLVAGILMGRSVAMKSTDRRARAYYFAIAVLIVLRVGTFAVRILTSHYQQCELVSGARG